MAQNRDDRLLMRQRGAGSHKIKDVDFGLSFPLPSHPELAAPRASTSSRPSRSSLPGEQALRSSSVEQATPDHVIRRQRSESTILDASRASEIASSAARARKTTEAGLESESHEPDISSARPRTSGDDADLALAGETPSLGLKRKRDETLSHGPPATENKEHADDLGPANDGLSHPHDSSQHASGRRVGRSQEWHARSTQPGDALPRQGPYPQSSSLRRSAIGRRSNATDRTQSWTDEQARFSGMQSTPTPHVPESDMIIDGAQDDEDVFSEVQEPYSRASSVARASHIADEYLNARDEAELEDEDEADVLGHVEPVVVYDEEQQEQEQPEESSGDEDEIASSAPSPLPRASSVLSSRASSVAQSLPGSAGSSTGSRQGSQVPQATLPAPRLLIRSKAGPSQAAAPPTTGNRRKGPSAPSRPRKQRRPSDPSTTLRMQAARNARRQKGAQVLVYRLSNTEPGPNGSEAGESPAAPANSDDGDEEDVLQAAPKFIRRPGVNAIDVLNQLFRELVEAQVETWQETPPPAPTHDPSPADDQDEDPDRDGAADGAADDDDDEDRRTRQHQATTKRKIKAIEAFAHELEERTFELTASLDANTALGIRVRQAQREKLSLRERLIHVRRQRDELARRIEAVKNAAYDRTAAAAKHDFVNAALHDIELAIKRGRLREADVAVGGGGGGGGGTRATHGGSRGGGGGEGGGGVGEGGGGVGVGGAAEDGEKEEMANHVEFWLGRYGASLSTMPSLSFSASHDWPTTPPTGITPTGAPAGAAATSAAGEAQDGEAGAGGAGAGGGGVGILNQVRDFNAFLERSLGVL